MGCGESKHAVATADTLTKSKSKGKNVENNPPVEGNVKENEIPKEAQKEESRPVEGDEKSKEIEKGYGELGIQELKEGKKEEEEEEEAEKVVSNDSVAPKKGDEEKIEAIDEDGKGKVEGNDALQGKGKEVEDDSNEDKAKDLKVDEGKEVVPAEEKKPSAATTEETTSEANVATDVLEK